MNNPLYQATVKADNRQIHVYRTMRETYCEYPACNKEYQKSELVVGREVEEKKTN